MKKGNIKIWHVIACVVFLILCFIGITNIRLVDRNNVQMLQQNITIRNDEVVEVAFQHEKNMRINYFELVLPTIDDTTVLSYEIIDEKGYYLDAATRTMKDWLVNDSVRVILEKQLEGEKEYILKLRIEGDSMLETEADLRIEILGYTHVSGICQALFVLVCLLIVVGFLLVVCEHPFYIRMKETFINMVFSRKAPTGIEYLVIGIFFLVLLMSHMDGDTKAFVHYEVNFWRSIFQEGGLRHFYDYSYMMEQYYKANHIGGAFAAYYDFPMFILFGIWGFPLYLICEHYGIEETSNMWTMVYGKAIFIVAVVVAAYIIYKICQNINISKKNSKWAVFLFLSSILVLVDVAYIGQLDIMGIAFTLLGIYYYQRNNIWRFILFFMIAVSFKQFPIFIFIPLLLLIEKNIIKIGFNTVIVLFFSKLSGLPFPSDTMAITVKNEFSQKSLEVLLGIKAPLYNEAVPIIILFLGAICVYCYLKQIETQRELEEYSIFISLLSMFVLLISFDSNPYWYIQLAPFVAILIMYNSKHYNNMILFETVGMICLILNQWGANYWCFEPKNSANMLMSLMFGDTESYLTMERFIAYTKLNQFSGVFFAGFVLCIGTVLWLSRPGKIESDENVIIRPYALVRMLANIAVAYIPILLYVVSAVLL